MSLICSAESAVLVLDLKEPECKLLPSAKLNLTAAQSLQNIGLESPAMTILESSPQNDSKQTESRQSTLFAEEHPVNHIQSLENNWVKKMTAPSGMSISVLSKNCGPLGLLEKMLLGSLGWRSTTCLPIWRHSATPQGRLIFQLHPLERSMNEEGFSSSGERSTMQKKQMTGGTAQSAGTMFLEDASTITANGNAATAVNGHIRSTIISRKVANVAGQKMWLTPSANEDAAGSTKGKMQLMLTTQVKLLEGVTNGGRLNPKWVAWLMGFPMDWTDQDSKPLETQLSPKSPKLLDVQLCKPKD